MCACVNVSTITIISKYFFLESLKAKTMFELCIIKSTPGRKISFHKATNTSTSLNKIYLWFYYTYV